jgi:hypothetical protein
MVEFKTWLKRAKVTDDPAGDFIADARRDTGFPDTSSRAALASYVRGQSGDDPAVMAAFATAWRRYAQWLAYRDGVVRRGRRASAS